MESRIRKSLPSSRGLKKQVIFKFPEGYFIKTDSRRMPVGKTGSSISNEVITFDTIKKIMRNDDSCQNKIKIESCERNCLKRKTLQIPSNEKI